MRGRATTYPFDSPAVRVNIDGAVPVTDHVDLTDSPAALVNHAWGAARILWRAGGTSLQWAVVHLNAIRSGPLGSVARISRLMALAINMQGLVDRGEVADCAELARLAHVSRPGILQIMNRTQLAPRIQEDILFLPLVSEGTDPVVERAVRPIAAEPRWGRQREQWGKMKARAT